MKRNKKIQAQIIEWELSLRSLHIEIYRSKILTMHTMLKKIDNAREGNGRTEHEQMGNVN